MDVISKFTGEYGFLSNFYFSPIYVGDDSYRTLEHAYQAAKTLDLEEKKQVRDCQTPGQAKRLGRKVTLRSDWDDVKIDIMLHLLRLKFQDKDLADKLIATGDAILVEGNTWGDTFWGVCKGKGHNFLGKLLENVRSELKQKGIHYDIVE